MLLLQLGLLFGQINRQPQAGNPGDAAGALGFMCVCYGLIFAVGLLIQILFLLNLSKTLAACSQRNRSMEPGMVWLCLIPLFGYIWFYFVVLRLSESLQKEYRSRGMSSDDPEFGKMTGLIWLITAIIPFVNIVSIVFFIIYWVKTAKFKNELLSGGRRGGYDDDADDDRPRRRRDEDDDDGDDRPRRRPRRDDDE
jgi:hypothetical protein